MPLEPSPFLKKAMEALGCPGGAPTEEAERVLRAFLGEAERVATARIGVSDTTPLGLLVQSVNQLGPMLVANKFAAVMSVAAGKGKEGLDSAPLGKLVALIATAATMFLKDMAFVGGEGGISGDCGKCTFREKCPAARKTDGG